MPTTAEKTLQEVERIKEEFASLEYSRWQNELGDRFCCFPTTPLLHTFRLSLPTTPRKYHPNDSLGI